LCFHGIASGAGLCLPTTDVRVRITFSFPCASGRVRRFLREIKPQAITRVGFVQHFVPRVVSRKPCSGARLPTTPADKKPLRFPEAAWRFSVDQLFTSSIFVGVSSCLPLTVLTVPVAFTFFFSAQRFLPNSLVISFCVR
jgi:hypothetical protein